MSRRFSIIGSGTTALTDNGSVLTSTEPVVIPSGSSSACGLQIGAANNGIYDNGTGSTLLIHGGVNSLGANTAGFSTSGKITAYSGLTPAGMGFPLILGFTSQKSETAGDTNVLTVTPAAAVGTYRLNISWSVTTATSAVIGWTATWTDSGGVAQAPTNLSMFQSGTAAPALTFTAATGTAYYATAVIDVNNSATAIVIKSTLGTGTLTASKLTAFIERLN